MENNSVNKEQPSPSVDVESPLNAPEWSRIDGFVIGVMKPFKTDWIWSRYVKPEFKSQADATRVPFQIGDLVSKSIQRPSDLTQLWRVVGMWFSPFTDGWKVTITRAGCTDLHRNSLYVVGSRCLTRIVNAPEREAERTMVE